MDRVAEVCVGGGGEGDIGKHLRDSDGELKDGECFKVVEDVWKIVKEKG